MVILDRGNNRKLSGPNMEFLSRKDARQQNLKRYFDGSTCVHGHTDQRYTSTGHCIVCRKNQGVKQKSSNPEKWKNYRRKRYEANREHEIELGKQWRLKNKERVRSNQENWRQNNIEKTREYLANRRASKKNATPLWLTDEDRFIIKQVYVAAKDKEKRFGIAYHVDHIIPLQNDKVCGLHVWWNLQVIPADINYRKSNSFKEV